ncbi:Transposon TX1 uncharacterized [Smittium culicis]|uniref:Transposon TX1 uncharacterized n=1 Tax=Smittium culicis TaxID=133412 RepID=A0A1R1YQS6_9FUNG|nr:Transposon TX1 uncharacterized [Smittium culicis]
MGNNSAGVFTECDTPFFWAEICYALKSTPNNKSPGYDGIPIEAWKRVHEIEPTSPFVKVLFRLIKEIWDTESIPEQLDPSVVVTIPKKGDMREPNNYRGISLISTLSKVVSKIIARRLYGIKGVKVPGVEEEILGLLFADDAVVLAESPAELQIALEKLPAWSKWEMQINQKKRGVMGINGNTGMIFNVLGKPLNQVPDTEEQPRECKEGLTLNVLLSDEEGYPNGNASLTHKNCVDPNTVLRWRNFWDVNH